MNGWIVAALFVAIWLGTIIYGTRREWTATTSIGGGFLVACCASILVAFGSNAIAAIRDGQHAEPVVQACNQSSWDSSVSTVENYLRAHLNDANFERVEWSEVAPRDGGGYAVRFKYRAKNAFGAWVLQNQIFLLGPDCGVLSVLDYDQS